MRQNIFRAIDTMSNFLPTVTRMSEMYIKKGSFIRDKEFIFLLNIIVLLHSFIVAGLELNKNIADFLSTCCVFYAKSKTKQGKHSKNVILTSMFS